MSKSEPIPTDVPADMVALTIDQAASVLQVHPLTVRRAIDAGSIPSFRLGDRRIRRIWFRDLLGYVKGVEAVKAGGAAVA
jgi:excisionase family DNA binding protein